MAIRAALYFASSSAQKPTSLRRLQRTAITQIERHQKQYVQSHLGRTTPK